MLILKQKAKDYQKRLYLNDKDLVDETIEVDTETLELLNKAAEELDTDLNTFINLSLTDFLVNEKIKELKKNDKYKDMEIMDSYSYCEWLESDEEHTKTILIVDYFDTNSLFVSIPVEEYDRLNSLKNV